MQSIISNRLSFRTQLAIAFGVLTFIVLTTLSAIWGIWSTRLLRTTIQSEFQARVHAASELIFEGLRDRSTEIIDLSRTSNLLQSPEAIVNFQSRLDNKRALKAEYAWVGVATPSGEVVAAAGKMLLGKDVTQREWFKAGRSAPWLGDVHEALLLSRLMPRENENEPLRFIDISAPVQDASGKLLGVLGAHLHWSWVTRLAESVLPGNADSRKLEVYILNREGLALYPFSAVGKIPFKQDVELKLTAGEITWEDGQSYLTAQVGLRQTPEQHLGWRIVLRQPVDVAYAPLRLLTVQMILATLLIALLAAWGAYRVASFITTPMSLLKEAVNRLGIESDNLQIPKRLPPELLTLANAIQTASSSLNASRNELMQANELLEMRVEERTRALGLANDALARQALTDGLTNVANRRAFDLKLAEIHALSARTGQAYGLIIIDADHFKNVNDQFGHHIGDSVLTSIAGQLTQTTRSTDFVARYGGEEFVVLLYPVASPSVLEEVAEKLRKNIESFKFKEVGNLTISLGGSVTNGESCTSEKAITNADAALYKSKINGRNRFTLF